MCLYFILQNGPQHVSGGDSANPCHFIFRWVTRVACPIANITTKTCHVTDASSGYAFNFEPLRAHQPVYHINGTNTKFSLAICGELNLNDSQCNGNDVAGCQIDSNQHVHSIGTYSSMSLRYEDGSITLTYSKGDNCSTGPRKAEIDFICDRNAKNDYYGTPEFVNEKHHCHYLFVWHTALACRPITLECIAGGGTYDLRPLMKTKNWIVNTLYGEIILGVCQSVSDARCNYTNGVGACLLPNNTQSSSILGFVTGDLVVLDDKSIQLTYHNGLPCSTNGFRTITVITFRCNSIVEEVNILSLTVIF